jgi:hypothetical protein
MKEKHSINFIIGLTIGGLLALLFWYWQKSTSAEDGALKLLDRLAETEKRARKLKDELQQGNYMPAKLSRTIPSLSTALPQFLNKEKHSSEKEDHAPEPEDLTRVKGIGPVFQQRLQENGVHTLDALRLLPANKLGDLLDVSTSRAENILAAAATL